MSHMLQTSNRDMLDACIAILWCYWTAIHDLPISLVEEQDLFIQLMEEARTRFAAPLIVKLCW